MPLTTHLVIYRSRISVMGEVSPNLYALWNLFEGISELRTELS